MTVCEPKAQEGVVEKQAGLQTHREVRGRKEPGRGKWLSPAIQGSQRRRSGRGQGPQGTATPISLPTSSTSFEQSPCWSNCLTWGLIP